MQYKYIAAYKIRGLIHDPNKGDVEIYTAPNDLSFKAILTGNVDNYCYELDRARALGYQMLRGFAGKLKSKDQKSEIEKKIDEIRKRRQKKIDSSEVLVVIASGETEPNFSSPNRETENFVLGFDVIQKEKINDIHGKQVDSALVALCLSTGQGSIQIKCLCNDVYLINENNKPVYSIGLSGSGEGYISIRTTDEFIRMAQSKIDTLFAEKALDRVNKLLVQAISEENDKLRRFMFGWSALEILINKVFSEYEKKFVQNLLGSDPANHMQKYFGRIRDVMEGKYRITDKFIIVAACISDTTIDSDIETFTSIKKKRDALIHGKDVEEATLPIQQTIVLLKKYLCSHIETKAA